MFRLVEVFFHGVTMSYLHVLNSSTIDAVQSTQLTASLNKETRDSYPCSGVADSTKLFNSNYLGHTVVII